jgi:hypothetical protein
MMRIIVNGEGKTIIPKKPSDFISYLPTRERSRLNIISQFYLDGKVSQSYKEQLIGAVSCESR